MASQMEGRDMVRNGKIREGRRKGWKEDERGRGNISPCFCNPFMLLIVFRKKFYDRIFAFAPMII
jgi:hypothetical protein